MGRAHPPVRKQAIRAESKVLRSAMRQIKPLFRIVVKP
jgi:hypothetical protein